MHQMLSQAAGRTSLHMPGGQGRAPFGRVDPYRVETTELGVTDDLYHPSGAIARAQRLAAASAGAAHTLLLNGGSTAGIHAMLLYAARRGDEVILPRNAHVSALNICATAGLEPVFAEPSYAAGGRPYTTVESYIRAMDGHPNARAVLVVRPDYYGALPELDAIALEAHRRGMLALCDEAHGAHLNWDRQIKNAGACGADLFVQSAHKTLPALNAGAWLHAMGGVDVERLRRVLSMVQTSSPSFLTMLALDDARAWMDKHGVKACGKLRKALQHFRKKAASLGYTDAQDGADMRYDPLRLVLYAPQGGFRLAEALARRGIDVEMSDGLRIVCILSLMDGKARLRKLLRALRREAPTRHAPPAMAEKAAEIPLPPREMPLAQAAFAEAEAVLPERAAGRVSAVAAGFYPPGIALVTPGELLTPEIAEALLTAGPERLFGMNGDGTINCVTSKGANT